MKSTSFSDSGGGSGPIGECEGQVAGAGGDVQDAEGGSPGAAVAPIDGFEWLSADSEWRDEPRSALAWGALHYAWRGPQTIASLFDRPDVTLARWDEAAATGRRLVALASLDAHARLGPRGLGEDPDAGVGKWSEGLALPVPSYEVVFKSLTTRVELDQPLARDAAEAAMQLVSGIRRGRVFTVVDALAGPGAFEFSATRPEGLVVRMGDSVAPREGPLRFAVRVAAPPSSRVVLRRNGAVVAESTGTELLFAGGPGGAGGPAAYSAEVCVPAAPGGPPVPTAVVLTSFGMSLEEKAEQIFEGITMLIAAGILTWMIF